MAVFTCPTCDHSQSVDDKHVGRNATCPKCKTQGVVGQSLAATNVTPEPHQEIRVRKGMGGRCGLYHLLSGRGVNPPESGTPLNLEWTVVDDPRLSLSFKDVCGVRVVGEVEPERYEYSAEFHLRTTESAVVAAEVRFLTFNVWGSHVRTLSVPRVQEVAPHKTLYALVTWHLGFKTEGEEHLASIGYVARVRTADGTVINADQEFVLREARRYSETVAPEDLEPPHLVRDIGSQMFLTR